MSKNELKTVLVEHNLQADKAELSVVEFIMKDPALGEVTQQEVEDMCTSVGFTDAMRKQEVRSLSGGWKIKLELARSILMNSDILFLDEPTNHLDVDNY